MTDYCCEIFKEAIDKEAIKFADYYERDHGDTSDNYKLVTEPLEPGYYIVEGYAVQEHSLKNYPAVKKKIEFCPWCSTKL